MRIKEKRVLFWGPETAISEGSIDFQTNWRPESESTPKITPGRSNDPWNLIGREDDVTTFSP